ncbi:chloride channel protein [Salegentibacter mishustinae]|uniref:Chloride channel protein n=1 Tax=Salegentibacter mishustinae TaxID=270918 RepID=A0A0Q9ZDI0_9FLAO|nr:chloride channel protein [Salegentibacter mishustinae]KRG28226.1 chloride channel protein [Salegentibacter mishustinae]PNW22161.1 chloride channel protein [Salegentibacter mishustinae]PZX67377.1 H+/Cl- antiporter ClcA [Salegentibacter mishustinae]GGW80180.1 chloride channel protein [Salegentibacter mishustinae]
MNLKQKKKLLKYLNILDHPVRFNPFVFSRAFLLWALLGLIGGVIAGVYWVGLEFLTHQLAFFNGWQVIPVMAISGLLAGLIIHFIGDPGEIHLIVNNIRFNKGKLDPKNNPSMVLSSLLCVASGGSLGPEAPLVQVTGSTGTWLGKLFRLKGEELRSLSIAGMASGFTALFGAPLGGSLFSLEILHHKHAVEYYKAIIPAFVASCFSYLVFALIIHLGLGPIWDLSAYQYSGIFDFAYAVLFAVIGAAFGWAFIFCTKFFKSLFEKKPLPIYIKTLIGGILLGIIAFYLPLTRYFGHHEINELLTGNFSLSLLFAILVFKIIAISITVTSGWRGGFIIPLFFVGTTLGIIIHHLFPSINLSLAIVSCMAAINACVTRTPMSTTILLATLTGFGHIIPILFASLTGYFLAPRIPFIGSQLGKE